MVRSIRLKECPRSTTTTATPPEHYLARSDSSLVNKSYVQRTDEHGFIVSGRPMPLGANKIIMLGDSVVEGLFLEEEARLPARIEAALNDTILPQAIQVLNGGYSGATILHLYNVLINKIVPLKPLAVVLMSGVNDAEVACLRAGFWSRDPWWNPLVDPDSTDAPKDLDEIAQASFADHEKFLAMFAQAGAMFDIPIWFATTSHRQIFAGEYVEKTFDSRQSFDRLVELRRAANASTRRFALENGHHLFDLERVLARRNDLHYDMMHLNSIGSAVAAQHLLDAGLLHLVRQRLYGEPAGFSRKNRGITLDDHAAAVSLPDHGRSQNTTKIAVVITGFRRPHLFKALLQSLVRNELRGVQIVAQIEPSPVAADFLDIAATLLAGLDYVVRVNPERRGVRANPYTLLESTFAAGAETIIYLEEDLLVSADLIELASWYSVNHRPPWLCLSLLNGGCGSPTFVSDPLHPDILFESKSFNSLGFVLRREEWDSVVRDVWMNDEQPMSTGDLQNIRGGWDWMVWAAVLRRDLLCLAPACARATNTGREGGEHAEPEFHDLAFDDLLIHEGPPPPTYRLVDVPALPASIRRHVLALRELNRAYIALTHAHDEGATA